MNSYKDLTSWEWEREKSGFADVETLNKQTIIEWQPTRPCLEFWIGVFVHLKLGGWIRGWITYF